MNRWILALLLSTGICLAMSDGPYFPYANILGVLLVVCGGRIAK
jgi:hypothetical protein